MGRTIIALGILRGQNVNKTPQDRAFDTSPPTSESGKNIYKP